MASLRGDPNFQDEYKRWVEAVEEVIAHSIEVNEKNNSSKLGENCNLNSSSLSSSLATIEDKKK